MNKYADSGLGEVDPSRRALDEIYATLGTSANGLRAEQAAARHAKYGPNRIEEPRPLQLIAGLAKPFSTPLVLILLFAAGVAGLTHEHASFLIIIAIVVLSVVIDFVQEHRAESAAKALRRRVALRVAAVRSGVNREVAASDLVPGDVVLLCAGDLVPADCCLIEARDSTSTRHC